MVIDQFLSGFHYGDAIGNSVLRFHKFLKNNGVESRIVAITVDDEMREFCTSFSEYRERDDSIKIYHYAISSPLNEYFLKTNGKKILVYHNITPSEFFKDFSDELVDLTEKGRKELILFNKEFKMVIADSKYNSYELELLGFKNIKTFPIMISRSEYEGEFSKSYSEVFNDGRKNVLFVGRVTPNKKLEDLLKFISAYKRIISNDIRLIIAGNVMSVPKYFSSLLSLKEKLDLSNSDVFFTGHILFDELLAVYNFADIFLSLSEHEGFCLPLIESTFFNLPVIAYDAGAVKETLDGSGLLLNEKKMDKLVFLTDKIMSDERIRKKMSHNAKLRADRYEEESDPEIFLEMILEAFNG